MGCRPVRALPCQPRMGAGRPAGSGALPAQLGARPGCLFYFFFLSFFLLGCLLLALIRCAALLCSMEHFPAGPRLGTQLPTFGPNGHILWPPIKRGSSPIFL